jgi:hypothetical protein
MRVTGCQGDGVTGWQERLATYRGSSAVLSRPLSPGHPVTHYGWESDGA